MGSCTSNEQESNASSTRLQSGPSGRGLNEDLDRVERETEKERAENNTKAVFHPHVLCRMKKMPDAFCKRSSWTCDRCLGSYHSGEYSHRCTEGCNFEMCDDCARKFDKTSDMSAEELSASWSEVVNGFASLFEEAWQALSSDDMIIVTDLPKQLADLADKSLRLVDCIQVEPVQVNNLSVTASVTASAC